MSSRLKPAGFLDLVLRRNLKNNLPKSYLSKIDGYCFWYDEKETSIDDVVKVIPSEVFSTLQKQKGLIVEHFSNHLVVNFNNCKIPSYNLSRFFDLGVSIKNSFLSLR